MGLSSISRLCRSGTAKNRWRSTWSIPNLISDKFSTLWPKKLSFITLHPRFWVKNSGGCINLPKSSNFVKIENFLAQLNHLKHSLNFGQFLEYWHSLHEVWKPTDPRKHAQSTPKLRPNAPVGPGQVFVAQAGGDKSSSGIRGHVSDCLTEFFRHPLADRRELFFCPIGLS